ncbi:hypothetical protein X743_30330 [Mesorhizobium sp. LNHC252B00]|nr:hypothetical protein X743_30330 [Mesorhizobium sp. LNHC252B00]
MADRPIDVVIDVVIWKTRNYLAINVSIKRMFNTEFSERLLTNIGLLYLGGKTLQYMLHILSPSPKRNFSG